MVRNGKKRNPKKGFSVRKVHRNTNECLTLLRCADVSYDNQFEWILNLNRNWLICLKRSPFLLCKFLCPSIRFGINFYWILSFLKTFVLLCLTISNVRSTKTKKTKKKKKKKKVKAINFSFIFLKPLEYIWCGVLCIIQRVVIDRQYSYIFYSMLRAKIVLLVSGLAKNYLNCRRG